MSSVILLLKRDVNNSVRNWLSNPIQKLGLTNNHLQLGVEVYEVIHATLAFFIAQNILFKHLKNFPAVFSLPGLENFIFIRLSEGLGQLDVSQCGLFTSIRAGQDMRLGLKLVDRSFNPSHNATGPCNFSRVFRHIFGSKRVFLV